MFVMANRMFGPSDITLMIESGSMFSYSIIGISSCQPPQRLPISSDDAWRSLRPLHWPSLGLHLRLLPDHWPTTSPSHGSWLSSPSSSLEFSLGALRLRALARAIWNQYHDIYQATTHSNRLASIGSMLKWQYGRKRAGLTIWHHGYPTASWILQQPPLAWFLWTAHSNAAAMV